MIHLYSSHSVASAIDQPLHHPPRTSKASLLSWSTDFHLGEGASPDVGISVLLQHAPLQSAGFVTLLLLFSSFFLPSYTRIIIVPTGDQSLLLVFSWCLVRAVAPVDVFLMHPWREMHSMPFYFSATLVFHKNVVLFLTSISSSRIRKGKI